MKQHRVTAADFAPKNPGIPDAYMEDQELARIKKLAGISFGQGLLEEYQPGTSDPGIDTPNNADQDSPSPVGSEISITGADKRNLENKTTSRQGHLSGLNFGLASPI